MTIYDIITGPITLKRKKSYSFPFYNVVSLKAIIILNSIALYFTANKFSDTFVRILHNCIQKRYFDISVPNFNVADCGQQMCLVIMSTPGYASSIFFCRKISLFILTFSILISGFLHYWTKR